MRVDGEDNRICNVDDLTEAYKWLALRIGLTFVHPCKDLVRWSAHHHVLYLNDPIISDLIKTDNESDAIIAVELIYNKHKNENTL